MKFSVLLPTRNRLELLKIALYSVIKQDFDDWEVIVSDNDSEEDIAGYIQSLNETRIKYFRTSTFVSVTDNWNNALEKSSGDYVIMLGDDDCLMNGYFKKVCELLLDYPDPDFIYTSGFLYAYPGVMPWSPQGFLTAHGNASFLESQSQPFWLEKTQALKLVNEAMNFKVAYSYNMQYATMSRQLIIKMQARGKVYQSSYPDYYAMTAMMLESDRILACPIPLVMVGISPKSYGFFHFNHRESDAVNLLKTSPEFMDLTQIQNVLLPGEKMITFWLFAMERVKINYANEFDLNVNYSRYRLLQIIKVYKKWISNDPSLKDGLKELWKGLGWKEKLLLGTPFHVLTSLLCCSPLKIRKKIANRLERLARSHPAFPSTKINGTYASARDVIEQVDLKCQRLSKQTAAHHG